MKLDYLDSNAGLGERLLGIYMYPTMWVMSKYLDNSKDDGIFGSILMSGMIFGVGLVVQTTFLGFVVGFLTIGIYTYVQG